MLGLAALIQELFAFDLSFAMTIHKAQGRTIPRVVVDLSHRENHSIRMNYAQIYVALSCVKRSSDVQLLCRDSASRIGTSSLEYITTLKHDVSILDYYSGFTDPTKGEMWDAQRASIARQARIRKEGLRSQ